MSGKGRSWCRRAGVFGDLPTRLLRRGLRSLPWFLEPVLLAGWVTLFFGLAGPQRRAVMANLGAMFPSWGWLRRFTGAYRVVWNFSATLVDAARVETGTGEMDWAIDGIADFEEMAATPEGCIILTAHMGNYDMAASLFSEEFGRTVFAVRAPEREPELQKLKEAELRRKEKQHPRFRTLYNAGGEMLGVELARILREGDVVAIQGDRVVFEVSEMEVEVEPGLKMRLPRGPLMLARITGAPVYPLFILREGWRRYRVKVFPKLELPPRQRGSEPAAEPWARSIYQVAKSHWADWAVFEEILKRKGGPA
ncbi:hypothetical protein [Haloferula sargassicola]|uniref:Lipid A biosynthesis acyltransferase n=1 Tax=Haloferula sargassicola TaxID=490096 RepID=A0ABP9UNZ8_9BACT